jgi:hypothetical protein
MALWVGLRKQPKLRSTPFSSGSGSGPDQELFGLVGSESNKKKKRKYKTVAFLYLKVVINVQMQPNDENLLLLELNN